MSKKITGAEFPLMKIFSSEFDYYIPSYQRPYAWTEEETGILFDDLLDFYQTEPEDTYFLGSIVLIKEENIPRSEVIDGQQRLTTLTILLSILTSCFTDSLKADYCDYLREPGRASQNLAPKPRLHLRQKDQDFFEKYIQNTNLDTLLSLNTEALATEAQRHIQKNCSLLINRIRQAFGTYPAAIQKFGNFLVQRCYLVSVSTNSQSSAFRVFSVMNSRGLDLMPIDIIKADLIGKMPDDEQERYTQKWEELEELATRSGFNDVFTHTRMIWVKAKAKKTLLEEFRSFIMPLISPKELIDEIIEPYTLSYCTLKNKSYAAVSGAKEVNQYLAWLNKIDNSDWMPGAIKFLAEHSTEPDYVLWFVRKLERLASYLHITAKDINFRVARYGKILAEMENRPEHSLSAPLHSVDLDGREKAEFLSALDGDIYKLTARRRSYILLRLDSFVSDGAAAYEPNILTIEHVLPQSPNNSWLKLWPDPDERAEWQHRAANLVLLTRRHNSEAQNYDFNRKKSVYFTSKNGITSYALTTQVVNEAQWTPRVVKERQKKLMKVWTDNWDLS